MRGFLLVLVGCGHPTAPVVPPPPIAVAVSAPIRAPAHDVLPALQPAPPWHLACATPPAPGTGRDTVYDFITDQLVPDAHQPRIAERSRVGHPRGLRQIDLLLQARLRDAAACWKWASARGVAPMTGTLAFDLAPDGYVANTAVVLPHPAPQLARCIADQIDGANLPYASARPTHVTAPLELVLADQPRWSHPPPRPPTRPPAVHAPSCFAVVDDDSRDVLRSPLAIELSDFDASRARGLIIDSFGCGLVSSGPMKETIRAAIRSNTGALGGCYARAIAGGLPAGGTIALQIRFWNGIAIDTAAEGAGDDAFHHCLADAAKEIWLDGSARDRRITVNYPFTLEPPVKPDDTLATLAADLDRPHTAAGRCVVRANLVRAFVEIAPWLDDDRVRGAIADLVTAARALPADEATACLATAETELEAFAVPRWPNRDVSWLDRTELVAPVATLLPFGDRLRRFHAEQLIYTPRRTEGLALLRTLATSALAKDLRDATGAELATIESATHLTGCGLP